MRRFDKTINIDKANLLAEQRHLESKGVINEGDKFFPEADKWMWNYCTFLGKFTDSKGHNYDLGIYDGRGQAGGGFQQATVHSDKPGDYFSGDFPPYFPFEHQIETFKRCIEAGWSVNKITNGRYDSIDEIKLEGDVPISNYMN